MNKKFLDVKDICVSKGNRQILSDISFSTKPGELISILGPSGSGKTTLVNTIMGFNHLDSGEILCDGSLLAKLGFNKAVDERAFSAVFQSAGNIK